MAKNKDKDVKTNAMRILDREKISYRVNTYECDDFIDGVHIADMLGQSREQSFKTLAGKGKDNEICVFVIPVEKELDLKAAARAAGKKSVELLHVKDINAATGYIRGGVSPIGMKKLFLTVIDESVRQFDEVIISGGRLGSQILLSPDDLIKVTKARVESIVTDNK